MRISFEWLRELVDGPEDPQDLAREFVRTGTEVEAIERSGEAFDHVVVGYIAKKEPHPDSDHMSLCQVEVGDKNVDEQGNPAPLQIVCGATNFNQGDKVVVAMIGAQFGDFKIKKSKLRGVESYGMNCSFKELGLATQSEGIAILPEDAPVGMPFAEYYGMADTILDCEITPNRPDCLSMLGVAREVSAIYSSDMHMELPRISQEVAPATSERLQVQVEDAGLCSRYCCRVIEDIQVGASPEWLVRRVEAAGGRSINNVVDVTNYVMYLTGQPLHAFDLDTLAAKDGKRMLKVRRATEGEQLVTLDDAERQLTDDMIVIADGSDRPVALAGVMGGKDTEVSDTTTKVALESACFNPGHISRTSRNLNLISESSIRFERQVDAYGSAQALDIACALLEQCAQGSVAEGMIDLWLDQVKPARILCRPERVCQLAGAQIETEAMVDYLLHLGCSVEQAEEGLMVVAPTNRPDLTREIDLVEEILRLWGMDKVEPTLPAARNHTGGLTLAQRRQRQISRILRGCGVNETSTYCFADPQDLKRLNMPEEGLGLPVELINPLVADQSQMRRSLIPGLLRSVAYNLNHGIQDIQLWEIGRVFFGKEHQSQPDEPRRLAAVLCGKWDRDGWNVREPELDFFDAKGIVEELVSGLRLEKVRYRVADPEAYPWLQPGRAAEVVVRGRVLGWIGNIHPKSLKAFDIDTDVVAFDLSLADLIDLSHDQLPYEPIPTLPGVEVDLALVVDEDVTYETVVQRIQSAGGKLLSQVHLFDVYRDEKRLGAGKKSMAFNLVYRSLDHTLTSKEVEKAHEKLVAKVCKATGGEVRA